MRRLVGNFGVGRSVAGVLVLAGALWALDAFFPSGSVRRRRHHHVARIERSEIRERRPRMSLRSIRATVCA